MQKIKIAGMRHLEDVDSNASTDTESTLETLGFTVAKGAGAEGRGQNADFALVSVEIAGVRVGSGTPTTSLGLLVNPGEQVILESPEEFALIKFISAIAGVHATLQAQIGYSS